MADFMKLTTYKGVPIHYNIHNGKLHFKFEDIERQVNYLFEAQDIIDEPRFEDCDIDGYVPDGVFSDRLLKVHADKKDTKSGKPYFKYVTGYDRGKTIDDWRTSKTVYPANAHNNKVFEDFIDQEIKVTSEKSKLSSIIKQLKRED